MTEYQEAIYVWLEQNSGEAAANDFKVNVNVNDQRTGQAFMNSLRVNEPEWYNDLTNAPADPFYVDEKMDEALKELALDFDLGSI